MHDDRGRLAVAGFRDGGPPGRDAGLRPSLTVARLQAGVTGSDGVIPRRAAGVLSARLVGGQRPRRVAAALRAHVRHHTPPGVTTAMRLRTAADPWAISHDAPGIRAASRALAKSFPRPPALVASGGTIPVVGALSRAGLPVILMGFARPDDGMHGPNERVDLGLLERGARACTRFYAELAATDAAAPRSDRIRAAA